MKKLGICCLLVCMVTLCMGTGISSAETTKGDLLYAGFVIMNPEAYPDSVKISASVMCQKKATMDFGMMLHSPDENRRIIFYTKNVGVGTSFNIIETIPDLKPNTKYEGALFASIDGVDDYSKLIAFTTPAEPFFSSATVLNKLEGNRATINFIITNPAKVAVPFASVGVYKQEDGKAEERDVYHTNGMINPNNVRFTIPVENLKEANYTVTPYFQRVDKEIRGEPLRILVKPTQAYAIAMAETSKSVPVGEIFNLAITFDPSPAAGLTGAAADNALLEAYLSIQWKSSDSAVLESLGSGTFLAKKNGSATVTATALSGKTATCEVTVKEDDVKATGLTLDPATITMYLDDAPVAIKAIPTPADAIIKTNWSVLDWSIASVSNAGVVTPHAVGNTYVMGEIEGVDSAGKKATHTAYCQLIVKSRSGGDPGAQTSMSVSLGASFSPYDVMNIPSSVGPMTWSSSNDKVVYVNVGGTVFQSRDTGTATLTAMSPEGAQYTCKITVTNPLLSKIRITNLNDLKQIPWGKERQIKIAASKPAFPAIATWRASYVNWKSNKPGIVSVDANGKLYGVSKGKAKITATSRNVMGKEVTVASFNVETVVVPVASISIAGDQYMRNNGTGTLKAAISPATASNKDIQWSSSNTRVVTVDNKGNIKAVALGEATITVQTTHEINKNKKGANVTSTMKVTVSDVTVLNTPLKKCGQGVYATTYDFGGHVRGSSYAALDLFNGGVNGAGYGWATLNKPIYPVADGIVVRMSPAYLVIKHNMPLVTKAAAGIVYPYFYSIYAHHNNIGQSPNVKPNGFITTKDQLGSADMLGFATAPHLHFELNREDPNDNYPLYGNSRDLAISPFFVNWTESFTYPYTEKSTKAAADVYKKHIFNNPPNNNPLPARQW